MNAEFIFGLLAGFCMREIFRMVMGNPIVTVMLRGRPRSALTEIKRLRSICAEAYQLAGVIGAPVKALDNLSDAASGHPLRHETFLPILDTDCAVVREKDTAIASQAAEIESLTMEWRDEKILCDSKSETIAQQAAQIQTLREALEPFKGKASFFSQYPPEQLVEIGTTVKALIRVDVALAQVSPTPKEGE